MQSIQTSAVFFWNWWVGELAELIPEWFLKLGQRREQRIVCAIVDDKIELISEHSGHKVHRIAEFEISDNGLHKLASHIKKHLQRGTGIRVGVRIDAGNCLIRRMEYPSAVKPRIEEILKLDLEQKTPFVAGEIYSDFQCQISPGQPTVLATTQLVVKRRILDETVEMLNSLGINVDFADAWIDVPTKGFGINFLKNSEFPQTPFVRTVFFKALAFFIIALICLALFSTFSRQEQALRTLNTKTVEVRKKAIAVRKAAQQIDTKSNMLRKQRLAKVGHYTVIEVWEEITKRLPDNAWVTELRVQGPKIQINGFAGAAASLVDIFDNSPMFQKTKLTAQVRVDPKTKKERFSIETNLIAKFGNIQKVSFKGKY